MAACKCFLVELLFRRLGRHLVQGKHAFSNFSHMIYSYHARKSQERAFGLENGCA